MDLYAQTFSIPIREIGHLVVRQHERALLGIITISFARALLASTPTNQLRELKKTYFDGIPLAFTKIMEFELTETETAYAQIEKNYGRNQLHLQIIKCWVRTLLQNQAVVGYLQRHNLKELNALQDLIRMQKAPYEVTPPKPTRAEARERRKQMYQASQVK